MQITFICKFESDSKLSRIEERAFPDTALIEIVILSSSKVLSREYLAPCGSISSVEFK
jgi:hypothetical protein